MNYKKIYEEIIIKHGSKTKLDCYCEYHHIIPRCIGGSDDKDNMIYVKGRVHVLLHWILCKIYPTDRKILQAFHAMTMINGHNNRTLNTNIIESARKYNAQSKRGVPRSEETKQKISDSMTGKTRSEETKQKIGTAIKSHRQKYKFSHNEETKQKLSKSHAGKTLKDETRQKISDSMIGKKKIKVMCPYCNKIGGYPQMIQWHFDNCKRK
jgi:hypothetical protein